MKIIMKNIVFIVLITVVFVGGLVQASKPSDPTYLAAVVEFNRATNDNDNDSLEENFINAQDLIRNSLMTGTKGQDVDIVVFPESVLNNYKTAFDVPDPKDKPILCDPSVEKQSVLNKLSCLAKMVKKYMIFNLIEKQSCTPESQKEQNDNRPCTNDGLTRYNTNVVFDRNGALIAKYHKFNPFGEKLINTTVLPDFTIFETDFGVKFGTIVCFDLLFKTPAQELVEKHGITDIIFPTYWFSELPFLTATQIQQSWSYGNNINFLAAGGNTPKTGTTGTGIYSGRSGALVAKMFGHEITDIFFAKVPKIQTKTLEIFEERYLEERNLNDKRVTPQPRRLLGLKMLREKTVDQYSFKPINESGVIKEEVCHKDVCCKFDLDVKTIYRDKYDYYSFKMIAFSGKREHLVPRIQFYKTCAIIACTDDKGIESCGHIFDDEKRVDNYYFFNKIDIEGKFNDIEQVLFTPNTVDQNLLTLPVDQFDFKIIDEGTTKTVKMNLKSPNSDLLTFGIYAMDYKSSSATLNLSNLLIMSLAVFYMYFNN